MIRLFAAGFVATTFVLVSCSSTSTPAAAASGGDDAGDGTDATDGVDAGPELLPGCTNDPGAPATTFDLTSKNDPTGGNFTLAQALAGFPDGSGKLTAAINTENGIVRCTLDDTNAPIGVANFIGLARGTRPYKSGSKWQTGHFYDGLIWHRVIPDFVIQGGDPLGTGTGGPGYDLPVENQVAEPMGALAQAAAAKPSGSQFYVVVGTGPAPQYNVFGTCDTTAAVAIAAVPTDANDKPKTPVHMLRVEIGRCN